MARAGSDAPKEAARGQAEKPLGALSFPSVPATVEQNPALYCVLALHRRPSGSVNTGTYSTP